MAAIGHRECVDRGVVRYLTGGTTRQARLVTYDEQSWEKVVEVKAKLLRAHGIGVGDRLVVCHPFSPWSIGQVHVEGALRCGCEVYPFGLNAHTPEILCILASVNPSHVCGGARYLLRIAKLAAELQLQLQLPSGGKLFVAGELLEAGIRAECEAAWGAQIVDVYGMAEFDAVGVELHPGDGELSLVDDYEYAIGDGQKASLALLPGVTGELWIRRRGDVNWHQTGDKVRVVGDGYASGFAARVLLQGRLDLALNFSDGSAISESQVQQVVDSHSAELQALQIQIFRPPGGDIIRAVCVPWHESLVVDHQAIRKSVININVDVADCFERGVIRDCIVDIYPSDRALVQTARGKRPLLVRMD